MGVPTNTFKTYDAVGIREDLSDVITTISPVDTLFFSSLGEAGCAQTKKEWQTDALAAAGSNAQLEGDDTTAEAITATSRVYNNAQIQKKSFQVTGTEEKVKKAGRKSEVAYQTRKKGKELAKDIEYAYLREVRQDGAAATARKMRGALNWVTTNLSKAADATLNADGTVTGGTARPITEEIMKDTLQDVWNSGGDPKNAYCGGFQKRQISGFAGTGNYRTAVQKKKLMSTVDIYVHDFGSLQIKPHRIMPASAVFLCDPTYWKKGTLRGSRREKLAKTGDSEKYHIIVEHTLVSLAEAANGRIESLTTG